MPRGTAAALPLVQLVSAGLALAAWVLLARTQSESYQSLPVQGLSLGVPVSLALTLGIPYLLPNSFRGRGADGRSGPWAVPVFLAVAAVLAASALGLLLVVVAGQVAGAVVLTGAVVAAGVLVSQLARIRLDMPLMLLGGLAAPMVPLVWLLVAPLPAPVPRSGVALLLLALVAAALALRCRPWAAAWSDVSWTASRGVVHGSSPLVVHLVAFGVLLQGPRLAATVAGADEEAVVQAHLLMLLLGAGATALSSVHSVLSVGLQTAPDDGFTRRRRRSARAYSLLGAGVSVTLMVVVWSAADILLPDLPALGLAGGLAAAVAMAALATYFSASALVLRSGGTRMLATSSTGVAAAYLTAEVVVPSGDLLQAAVRYAGALVVLSVVLVVLARDRPPRGAARGAAGSHGGWGPVTRTAVTSAAGALPSLLVAGTALLLR